MSVKYSCEAVLYDCPAFFPLAHYHLPLSSEAMLMPAQAQTPCIQKNEEAGLQGVLQLTFKGLRVLGGLLAQDFNNIAS